MAKAFFFKDRKIWIRLLNPKQDLDALNKFCVQNSEFFDFQSGKDAHLMAAEEIMTELPPGKQMIDKSIWGAFEQDRLLAIIEGTADYPKNGIWYLGLFIIDDCLKKTGFSSGYYHYFEKTLLSCNVDIIRIAVLADNSIALNFWLKTGFIEIERKEKTFCHQNRNLIVMEKKP